MPKWKWEATIFVSGTFEDEDYGDEEFDDDAAVDAALVEAEEHAKRLSSWDDHFIEVSKVEAD